MTKLPKILIVGGLPKPSGGVTVFLGRLVNKIGHKIEFHILDIHKGKKEFSLAKSHRIAPTLKLLKQFWLFHNILTFRGDAIHFNYSRCSGLIAIAFMPKLGRKFLLTLHNGSQTKQYLKLPKFIKYLIKIGSIKIDLFFSICQDHNDLLALLNIKKSCIIRTKTQIQPPRVWPKLINESHVILRNTYTKIIVSSGHLAHSYKFEYLIKYVNDHSDVGGIVFLYGDLKDKAYLKFLVHSVIRPNSVLFYFHRSEVEFLSALACSDVYIRPTEIDSWGITIADSLSLGIPAIASDICERHESTILFPTNNYKIFENTLNQILNGRIQPNYDSNKLSTEIDFYNAYIKTTRKAINLK